MFNETSPSHYSAVFGKKEKKKKPKKLREMQRSNSPPGLSKTEWKEKHLKHGLFHENYISCFTIKT